MDLKLTNLRKLFGERIAVEIPELTIHAGEFFTFVGPSGCGKSTTLNMIAGLEEASAGTLRLGDRELTELPPHQRDIAFVFQTYALYPHRTVAQNLAFPLELAKTPRAEIRRRMEETAAMLGLTALLGKRPRQLSGGERQRVALGRAIIREPQLFLFDEPLSNLDAVLRAQMRRELKRLHQQLGTTFIYVTHDQEEALSLSDRIAILRDGRIQQCGTPRELYDQPVNQFVASFFGSPPMNFLEGRPFVDGGDLWVMLGKQRMRVGNLAGDGGPGSRLVVSDQLLAPRDAGIVVGIRPEHIRLSREATPESWPMRVSLVEPHGGQVHVELEAEGLRLTASSAAGTELSPGQSVWVQIPATRVHLFDSRGARINALCLPEEKNA